MRNSFKIEGSGCVRNKDLCSFIETLKEVFSISFLEHICQNIVHYETYLQIIEYNNSLLYICSLVFLYGILWRVKVISKKFSFN